MKECEEAKRMIDGIYCKVTGERCPKAYFCTACGKVWKLKKVIHCNIRDKEHDDERIQNSACAEC